MTTLHIFDDRCSIIYSRGTAQRSLDALNGCHAAKER